MLPCMAKCHRDGCADEGVYLLGICFPDPTNGQCRHIQLPVRICEDCAAILETRRVKLAPGTWKAVKAQMLSASEVPPLRCEVAYHVEYLQ